VAIFQNRFVKWVLAPVAVFGALGWAYFQYEYPTCTFRYKLTAEVMTPDGLKTGSSVLEVSYSHYPDAGGGESANLHMTGEATYVDLGQGKNLFVLLTNRESGRNDPNPNSSRTYELAKGALDAFALPIKMFGLTWTFGQEQELCKELVAASTIKKREVPFESLPTLVTFADIGDPKSVKVVQPDRFEVDFGVGYKFLSAKIEAASELPQKSIERVLTWLPEKKPKDHSIWWSASDPLIDQLYYISFIQTIDLSGL
jgi:hypothetical protein